MKRIVTLTALLLFVAIAQAQVNNPSIVKVASDPTGNACTNPSPLQWYAGTYYGCDNTGHRAAIGGGGSGTVNAGTAKQIGVYSAATAISGYAGLTWDEATGTAQFGTGSAPATTTIDGTGITTPTLAAGTAVTAPVGTFGSVSTTGGGADNYTAIADPGSPVNGDDWYSSTTAYRRKFRGNATTQTYAWLSDIGTWGALNYPAWSSGTPFVKMTAAGTFALDTTAYQANLGLVAGTFTDGEWCIYTASGTVLNCNVTPVAAQVAANLANSSSTGVTGLLPVANGGTGLGTLTAHAVQVGEGTSTPAQVGPDSTTTHALFSGGASADPAFRALATADLPTAIDTRTVTVTDVAPVTGDDNLIVVLNPATAVHLTRISCGVTGTTSVITNLTKAATSLIADMTATAGDVNQVVVTTWANGSSQCGGTSSCAVAAHTPVTLHIGTISGTPTSVSCAVDYTVD